MKEADSYQFGVFHPQRKFTEERLTRQGIPRISAGSLSDTPTIAKAMQGVNDTQRTQ